MDLEYYSNVRNEIIEWVPINSSQQVIEFGCGTGSTLAYLKETGRASYVCGVEVIADCEVKAKENKLDEFIIGDINEIDFKRFDKFHVILLLDVLEHLYYPFEVIKKCKKILKPGGMIIVSLPNIRNFAILNKTFVKGLWDYESSGILDSTHIRFFTDKSFRKALIQNIPELKIDEFKFNYDEYGNKIKKLFTLIPFFKELSVCQLLYKIKQN